VVWPCWIHAPNYVCFGGKSAVDEFPISYYEEFLSYVRQKYEGALWHALPGESPTVSHCQFVARFA
jgi:hypothetical protein